MDDFGYLITFGYTIRLLQDGQQFYENVFKNPVLVVGRDSDCELNIQSPSISRKHLKFEVEDDKLFVSDLGSSNGTTVDGIQLTSKIQVSSRSQIKAGRITIQVDLPDMNK